MPCISFVIHLFIKLYYLIVMVYVKGYNKQEVYRYGFYRCYYNWNC